ncbi:MAG: exodeoxyribonuclease VII large subunit [Acidithiobacillales bacterium SG8_45]|jgi:exodeoxyribonuclease VII large subunit|nr:MAG: exodeoxyribonuclease VII large subunit [Acidithiobacillales bacterium SG8_45]
MTDLLSPLPDSTRDVYTVSRLNREAKALLEGGLGLLWLEGEISNLARPASGHMYFSLKDAQSQVRCAFFRGAQRGLGFQPEDGMQVLLRARVSLYEARGEFQLIVDSMEAAGEGALRRKFELLKVQLLQEGLFDASHKMPLPTLPRRIGVITSPSGAVLHDILTTLARRFPSIPVLVYPVPVQGAGAAAEIAAMIARADQRAECDVLILARGGGSLEDLWSFNEEVVARAIYQCSIPLVSGVGHETDITIADMVADARAPTPTAAAEMLSPDQRQWMTQLTLRAQRLIRLMQDRLNDARQGLDWTSSRLVHPRDRIRHLRDRLTHLSQKMLYTQRHNLQARQSRLVSLNSRLRRSAPPARVQSLLLNARHLDQRLKGAMQHRLQHQQQTLAAIASQLHTLSPLATLDRGYAIITDRSGSIVRNAGKVKTGDRLYAKLSQGGLECVVEEVHEKD